VAAGLAEVEHESHHLRVGEVVVLGDGHDLLVALVLEGVLAQPRLPLHAVGGEAEEVRRRVPESGVLGGRGAVDEGDLRLRLGVILHGQALGARERSDQDVDLVLLDQLARGGDGAVGRGVGRSLDDLYLFPTGRVVVFLQGQLGTAHAVLTQHRKRPLERGEHADLDGLRGSGSAGTEAQNYGRRRGLEQDSSRH
jgi:hypothetical protein